MELYTNLTNYEDCHIEVNKLWQEKQALMRQYDRDDNNLIFLEKKKELESKIKILTNKMMGFKGVEIKERESRVEKKTEELLSFGHKKGRKVNKSSFPSIVAKVLSDENTKDEETAINKIMLLKNDVTKKQVEDKIRIMIRCVKSKTGRWADYIWDGDKFLLKKIR